MSCRHRLRLDKEVLMLFLHRRHRDSKLARVSIAILTSSGGFLIMIILIVWARANSVQAAGADPPHMIKAVFADAAHPACQMTSTLVLAAYQAWHGLPNHLQPPPYISTDPDVIARHIRMAQEQCIDGFIVDWYGPPRGLANDERGFIDRATAELLRQSAAAGFKIGLMYDEGTLSSLTALTTTQVISDLIYARSYFTLSNYLTISGKPTLFVFPYPNIDPHIDWSLVRQKLGIDITLLDEDPDPSTSPHDALFDGFYAWVQATPWITNNCADWGENYLNWFYRTMLNPTYRNKLMVGGVWPGFDDSRAVWGKERCMDRRCGRIWRETWNLVKQYQPPVVLIETWNDFEEGTDIEYSISTQTVWREDFNPLNSAFWFAPTAIWEDVHGPTAILREDNPDANYGKVETHVIGINADTSPFLWIDVTAVDPGASLTIQILDKHTGIPRDLLKNITSPGLYSINLAQGMDWHGVQSFTINIWIGGESKTVTFNRVSVQSACCSYLPILRR